MLADLDMDRRSWEQLANATADWPAGGEVGVPVFFDYPEIVTLTGDVVGARPMLQWFEDRFDGIADGATLYLNRRDTRTAWTLAEPPQRSADGALVQAQLRAA